MRITSRVSTINRFPQLTREVSELARRSCQEAAEAGAAAARELASTRRLPITLEPAKPTGDGWVAGFVCVHPAVWYQELGTLGNRDRPLKRNPSGKRSRAPGTGIEPLYALHAGKKEGRKRQRQVIRQGLPR
jgi:hypothetical protein